MTPPGDVTLIPLTYDAIFAEARRRIPRYAPEWTDFNDSDPGIALLQLFAWMSDLIAFEVNRGPERSRAKLLELVGLRPLPGRPSTAYLSFTADLASTAPGTITRGWRVDATPAAGGDPVAFETAEDLDLVRPGLAMAMVSEGGAAPRAIPELLTPDGTASFPFGSVPQVGSALYLGFGPDLPPPAVPSFPATWRIRVLTPPEPDRASLECPGGPREPVPPAGLRWEYKPDATAAWRPLQLLLDESVAFTREGDVRVEGPALDQIAPTTILPHPAPLLWVRCRMASGAYPPSSVPRVDCIVPNSVRAISLATVRDEDMPTTDGEGVSSGLPAQTFVFRNRPVATEDLVVEVIEGDEDDPDRPPVGRVWRLVEDLQEGKPQDEVFTLDQSAGRITFGDGQHGRIPVAGARVVARSYRYGGGAEANVPAGAATALNPTPPGVASVTNLRPAVGGAAMETIDKLAARAPGELRRRARVVTAADFEATAERVGGVRRARAIPNAHPDYPGLVVPGTVQVVVLPDSREPQPRATPALREAVCEALDEERLITTEIVVSEPRYVVIGVQAILTADPAVSFDAVRTRALDRLKAYLDPGSWSFGDDLNPSSLYAVLLKDEQLRAVTNIAVSADQRPAPLGSPVQVPADGLVVSGDHTITVRPDEDR